MKNLVFNLRTAKAQAEGCAKVTKSRRMAKILTTLTLLLTLGVGQMWAAKLCDLTSSGDVNRSMPNYEAGYDMGTIYVWFSINGGSYSSKGSTSSNIGTDRAIDASNITSGLKFNKFSVPVYCHNQWHGDACNKNGARIVDNSLVMSWKVSNPSGTEVSSGNFTTTTNVSLSWTYDSNNCGKGTWTSNTSEQNLLTGVSASTSGNLTYTMDFWYKFKCHMYNSSGSDWGSDVNVWYPGGEDHFKYQFTIPKTKLTVNTSGDDGSATASSAISTAITYNTNYNLTASDVTGYDFVNWTTSDANITITSATSRTGAKVKFTAFSNATITANYTPHTYTITYENMTGATNHASNPSNYNIESSTITLYAPKKTGYIFNGWYSDSGLTTPVTSIANGSTGNKTLYAKWTAITISEVSASPSSGSTGVQTMTVSFKTNVPRNSGYYYRIAEFGGVDAGTTGGGFHSNGNPISSGDASTLITSGSFSTINFTSTGVYTSAIEIYTDGPFTVQKRVTFTYGAGNYYTVSFDLQGHGSSISSQSILSGGKATAPSPAPTATGYTFGGWYKEPACTNAWNFSTETVTSDKILYAKWTAKNTTITLDRQGGTTGSTSVTATYDAAMPSTTMPGKTGYSFLGYYGSTGGSGTKYYNTDGSSAHVWDVDASTRTIYANWSENMTTVTVNVSPSGAGTLTVGGSSFTPGNTTTAGVTTSRTVVATAKSGYGFDYWTTGGNATGSATTNTYTLNGNGSGSTGTLTANFYTKSNSGWYMEGADFGGWSKPTTYQFDRAYRDIANTYYMPVTLTASHYWKVHNGTNAYNTNSSTSSDQQVTKGTVYSLSTNETKSSYVSSTMSDVWVVINTGTNKKLWVQDPATYYTITLANGSSGDTGNGVAGTEGTITLTTNDLGNLQTKQYASGERVNISVSAKTGYYVDDITIGATSVATDVLASSYSGYTTMPSGNATLTVTYKPLYSVTFGVGTGMSSYGSVSNNLSISSGTKVLTGTSITFTATPNLGYKFVGWYREATCTNQVSTDNPYTVNVTSATTLYAKFAVRNLYIHADFISNWATPAQMTQSTVNRAIYTYTINNMAILASAQDGDAWNTGYHFHFVNTVANPNDNKAYNYNGVQTPTYSGSSIDGVHKTHTDNPTIEFGLTRKSNVTITLTLQSIDDATKPTLNIAADPIYTITHGDPTHGSYTIKVGSASAVGTSTESVATTTITLAATPATGYHFDHWTVTKAGGGTVTVTSNQFTMPSDDVTVAATFLPTSYDVTLKANGGSGADKVVSATYDAAMPSILKGGGTLIAHSRTGYNFAGYYDDASTGTQYYTNVLGSARAWDKASATNLFAHWSAKTYTITLTQSGETGYGSSGTASVTATYDAALPSIASLPTAAEGYAFMGYYTGHNGTGTQYYGATGNKVVATYTNAGALELFAYFKSAEITDVTLNAGIFEPAEVGDPDSYVTADPVIEPTPTPTTKLCWELRYSNDNKVEGRDPISVSGNKVKFLLNGLAAGGYKIHVELRTGSECGAGTLLSSYDKSFSIASDHIVTVQYKCGDFTLKAPTSVGGKPLAWSDDIAAPDITGYTFASWEAGDGVTIKDAAGEDKTTSTYSTIKIKANYDSKLTAVYNKKNMIYFYNTLGWDTVFVYFYENGNYWSDTYGTGANQYQNWGGQNPYWFGEHGGMKRVAPGSDIWYFDYTAAGYETRANVVFADKDQSKQVECAGDNACIFFSDNAKVARRSDHNSSLPMFVPLSNQTGVNKNENRAKYYSDGYWMNYPENTGYTLKLYSSQDATTPTRTIRFPFSADTKMPLKLDVELNEAATNYYYTIYREDGTVLSASYGMNKNHHTNVRLNSPSTKISIKTTAPGIYKYSLVYMNNSGTKDYYISVDYPIVENDYRVLYSDNAQWSQSTAHGAGWSHPSDVVRKNTDAEVTQYDTVSFYISKGAGITASMKFQYAKTIVEAGTITWQDVTGGGINAADTISKAGVYNFIIKQEGTAKPVVEKVEPYTGNYYIRTDGAGSTKWDYYRTSDHEMTYTEFSMSAANSFGEKYSHYFMRWSPGGTNIKFCVANDYSPSISDTLEYDLHNWNNLNAGGELKHEAGKSALEDRYSANVRFMYNQETNKISRAYVASSTNTSRLFLVLRGNEEVRDENGSPVSDEGVTNGAILSDKENWIYERILYIKPDSRFKLFACYAEESPTQAGAQYFRGAYESGAWAADNTKSVILISGTGDHQKARILYDFKTNRLICAWLPSDATITEELKIDADVMVIRDHQEAAECITFSGDGELKKVKTVYGAMKFNRWTLNNRYRGKGGVEDNNKDHCATPADIAEYHGILPAGEQKSVYERSLYFISFPFDVKVSEIFGFGTYGKHWVLEYYDGLNRAKNGYWIDSPANWKYVTPSMAKTYELKAYEGYILCLSLGRMAYDNTEVWPNDISNVELYFPSKTEMEDIQTTNVTIPGLSDEYRCTINRGTPDGDRRIKDSYWRCLGVPSYDIYAGTLTSDGSHVINWRTTYDNFPFIYAWNMDDNTLTAQSTNRFTFKPMHAYLAQIGTPIYWTNVSATPAVMARQTEEPTEYNWCLTLNAGEQMIDQTYIRMSTDEHITNEFDFGQDLAKELNAGRSDIYSFIGYELAAANSMQMNTETTTIVPLGLNIEATGEYTFSIPDGTNGIGITLIDEETGIRTSLSALDYTVELAAGDYTERFWLEISPVKGAETGIDPGVDARENGVRKVMIDGILYIIRDGKMYDARGARVE